MSTQENFETVRDLVEHVRERVRSKEVIAYTLDSDDSSMVVNLPVGEPGPAYGWIGLWNKDADITDGIPPHTVVAAGPASREQETRELMKLSHPLSHQAEIKDGAVTVIIATAHPAMLSARVRRVGDIDLLLDRWAALSVG